MTEEQKNIEMELQEGCTGEEMESVDGDVVDAEYEPEYVRDWKDEKDKLSIQVAGDAVNWANKKGETRAAKKQFDESTEELARHIELGPRKPAPVDTCRKCGCERDDDHPFVNDQNEKLCQHCADNELQPLFSDQAQDALAACPDCDGKGLIEKASGDDYDDCQRCDGEGKITPPVSDGGPVESDELTDPVDVPEITESATDMPEPDHEQALP